MNSDSEEKKSEPFSIPESGEISKPVSAEQASIKTVWPRRIAQMFEPRHDWEAIYPAFRDWIAQGRGTDKAFALSMRIPYGSLARHAAGYRRKMAAEHVRAEQSTEVPPPPALEAVPFSSLPTASTLARPASPASIGHGPAAPRGAVARMEQASPAPELFTPSGKAIEKGWQGAIARIRARAPEIASRLLAWTDRTDNPAAVAALKEAIGILKDAEKDSPTASPFEGMSNEEIGMLVSELWPVVASEREVLVDLKKSGKGL